MGISFRYSLIFALCTLTACGPAFESYQYGVNEDGAGGGLGNGAPVINDPSLPATANVVRNPSFESGFDLWEDWGSSFLLTSGASAGSRALRISGPGTGGLGQEILFRIKTGATYNLTAQAKVANMSDEVYVGVRFFDLSNATIADIRVRIQSTTYKPHSVSVMAPKGASSAKVYAWKQSTANSFADVDDFSLVQTAPPTAPAKEASVANPNGYRPTGPGGTYSLVLDESFSGSALNATYWNSGLWFNSVINNELQAYRPENVRVSGGNMQLVAENRTAQTTWGQTMSYASGAITTRNKFAFTFGVVEARLRLPRGQGLLSAFSLEPNNKRSPPAINVMNGLGSSPTTANFSYKFYDINGAVRALMGGVSGVDFSDSYHTFTVEWTPDAIRFYVDGALKGSYTGDSILRDDAFIVLSLVVGGNTAGTPAGVGFPQTMEVDYVRVWQ